MNIIPTDLSGNSLSDGQLLHDPRQLINNKVNIKIIIHSAKLPSNVSDIFVEYLFDGKCYRTPVEKAKNNFEPLIRYDRIHSYKSLTSENLDYLINGNITFKLFGMIDNK